MTGVIPSSEIMDLKSSAGGMPEDAVVVQAGAFDVADSPPAPFQLGPHYKARGN